MDNNNTLPYGAISSPSDGLQRGERRFVPEDSSSAVNNVNFNPLLVARNVGLDVHRSDQDRNGHYQFSTRHFNSASRSSPYRIPHFNHNMHSRNGQNFSSSSLSFRDSDVSLIIDNNNPSRDVQALNNHLSDTAITNTPSNRYFHPPWSSGERTQSDTSRVPGNNCLDTSLTGRATAHLPIIREEAIPSVVNPSVDVYRKHRLKRRVSKDDADDSLPRPASKLLLTEEKMAAKMHNLSISNDHNYHLNVLQTNSAGSSVVFSNLQYSSREKDNSKHKEDDNNNMGSGDATMFVLAPGVKEALEKNSQVVPQSLIDHMTKPCLAVIPWTPQDDLMAKISLNVNKTDDEKAAEKNTDYFKNRIIGDISHQANVGIERVVHSDIMDDTFEFDEDDMDL